MRFPWRLRNILEADFSAVASLKRGITWKNHGIEFKSPFEYLVEYANTLNILPDLRAKVRLMERFKHPQILLRHYSR